MRRWDSFTVKTSFNAQDQRVPRGSGPTAMSRVCLPNLLYNSER